MKKNNKGQAKKLGILAVIIIAITVLPSPIPQPEPWSDVAPTTPCLSGPEIIRTFNQAEFVTMSQDNDTVKYILYWGDGTNSSATMSGGQYWHVSHAWTFPGKYIIQAKAIDSSGLEAIGCMKLITVS